MAEAASPNSRSFADFGGASLVSAAAIIIREAEPARTESEAVRMAVVADLRELVLSEVLTS
jgi:hypothetical protein